MSERGHVVGTNSKSIVVAYSTTITDIDSDFNLTKLHSVAKSPKLPAPTTLPVPAISLTNCDDNDDVHTRIVPTNCTLSSVLQSRECTEEQWRRLSVRAYFVWLVVVIGINGLLFGVAAALSQDPDNYLIWTSLLATLLSIALYWTVIGYGLHRRHTSLMKRRGTLHCSVVIVLLTSLSIGMYVETRIQRQNANSEAEWVLGLIPPFLVFLLLAVLVSRQRMIYHAFRAFKTVKENLYRDTLLLQLVVSLPIWAGEIVIVAIKHDQALAMSFDVVPMVVSFGCLVYYTYKCYSVPPSFSDYQSNGRVLITAVLLYTTSTVAMHLLPNSATFRFFLIDWSLICIGEIYILDSFLPVVLLVYFDINPVDRTIRQNTADLDLRGVPSRDQTPQQKDITSHAIKMIGSQSSIMQKTSTQTPNKEPILTDHQYSV